MAHILLVPGANHGGWWYAPIVERLQAAGHSAESITLTGLDPDGPPAPAANLDSHVREVIERVATAHAEHGPVVLVGHSYGGSVITGAADAHPERIAQLVYLDAFVPRDGDTCWSMTTPWERDWYIGDAGETGLAVAPLSFFDDRARPQPIGTLLQRSRLTGAFLDVAAKDYVLAADPDWLAESPFGAVADRFRADPAWQVVDADCTHNFLRTGPDLLMSILFDLLPDPDSTRTA